VPAPDIVVPLSVNASGGFDLPFTWPTVPAGIRVYLQAWIADSGASGGWSASNALLATSQ
jgi:hypothetical protein